MSFPILWGLFWAHQLQLVSPSPPSSTIAFFFLGLRQTISIFYLSLFFYLYSVVGLNGHDNEMVSFFLLLINTRTDLLIGIKWSVPITKSRRIFDDYYYYHYYYYYYYNIIFSFIFGFLKSFSGFLLPKLGRWKVVILCIYDLMFFAANDSTLQRIWVVPQNAILLISYRLSQQVILFIYPFLDHTKPPPLYYWNCGNFKVQHVFNFYLQVLVFSNFIIHFDR